jgi:hypothetical protein
MLHSPPSPPRRQSDLPPALRRVGAATLAAFAPPPTLTVSQWADREYLSPEASAEPGQWETARAEYLRGVMDAISDPAVTRVVVAKGSQVGYGFWTSRSYSNAPCGPCSATPSGHVRSP